MKMVLWDILRISWIDGYLQEQWINSQVWLSLVKLAFWMTCAVIVCCLGNISKDQLRMMTNDDDDDDDNCDLRIYDHPPRFLFELRPGRNWCFLAATNTCFFVPSPAPDYLSPWSPLKVERLHPTYYQTSGRQPLVRTLSSDSTQIAPYFSSHASRVEYHSTLGQLMAGWNKKNLPE